MTTRALRVYIGLLEVRRDLHRRYGDARGAELLDEQIERLIQLADDIDRVLSRLGNPPTDEGRSTR